MVLLIGERVKHQFGGSWTVEKLDALRAYLNGYAQALKKQTFNRLYIDAFAGTGDRSAKRQETATLMDMPDLDEMTKGSARIALEVEPPFTRYIYIEKRQRRSSALEHLKSEFPNRTIDILNKDANSAVQQICRDTDWRFNRAVLFLDPMGCRSLGRRWKQSPQPRQSMSGCSTRPGWDLIGCSPKAVRFLLNGSKLWIVLSAVLIGERRSIGK